MGPEVPRASAAWVAVYASRTNGLGRWNVSDFLKNGLLGARGAGSADAVSNITGGGKFSPPMQLGTWNLGGGLVTAAW